MKILLILIIIICFVFLGVGLSKYYTERKKFFLEFGLFVSNINSNINFGREKIINIIEKYEIKNKSLELQKLCDNYVNALRNKNLIDGRIFDGITILKNDEKQLLQNFFGMLGKFDIYSQSKEIASYSARFEEIYSEVNKDCKKYASLIIKLSLVLGLLVCLLII
ncbi:MAG: hypothetical protein IJA69_01875 [Clostridia bacterium]|nr:hypothetical protein [Clostridia bacterium]